MKKWLIKNKKPASLQDPDIRDHCAESLYFSPDVQRWVEYGKDDLPNAILGHFLEVKFLVLLSIFPYAGFYPLTPLLLIQMVPDLLL